MTARGNQRTALVVDSGACLPPELAGAPQVTVVPMSIEVDGRVLRDGLDISSEELYAMLRSAGPLPSSSSPSPGEYLRAFREATADSVLCLTIPGSFSTMERSARVAAEMLREEQPGKRVEVMDSGTAAAGFTLVAEAAAAACAAGLELEQVVGHVARLAASTRVIAALETMRFLVRSGRVPALAGRGSDLLRVRPVFAFVGGDVRRLGLVQGTRRALRTVVDSLYEQMPREAPLRLAAFCGEAASSMEPLVEALRVRFGVDEVEQLSLTPVIALHTGPGLFGAAAICDLPLPG